jgi:hypothetical protein
MSVNILPGNAPVALPGKNNRPASPGMNEPQPPRPNTPGANAPGNNSPKNPSPRPNTPGPNAPKPANAPGPAPVVKKNHKERSASQYLEEDAQEEAELQMLKQQAAEIWKVKGPICDSEGFYQHTGECWNDALQQIFCNADGLKEPMQYTYIHWVFNTDYHTQIPDVMFVPNYLRDPETSGLFVIRNKFYIDELKKWFNLYLRESQKRFLRHYILETRRRNVVKEVCALEGKEPGDIAREKIMAISRDPAFRKKGVQAEKSAVFGKVSNIEKARHSLNPVKELMKPTRETYVKEKLSGGMDDDEDYIIDLYNQFVFRNELKISDESMSLFRHRVLDMPKFKPFLNSATGVFISIRKVEDGEFKSGHAMAFYECGKQTLFYEDNYGSFPFEWRDYLLKFMELTKENLEPALEFTKFRIISKEKKVSYYCPYFPILSYKDKEGKYHTLLFVGGEVIETNDGTQTKFTFNTVFEGFQINVEYDTNSKWVLSRFVFFEPPEKNLQYTGNVGFNINTRARIKKHPIIQGFLEENADAVLEAIETEPVVPDLALRREGREDFPVVHIALGRFPDNRIVVRLIEKGYDIKTKYEGESVMDWAADHGHLDIIKALIEKDRSLLEERNAYDRTPLSVTATEDSYLDITKYLIEQGADIEAKTNLGRTPLYFAAREGAFETVKYLCSKGADSTVIDKGNPADNVPPMTPAQIAKTPEIREFLLTQCKKTGGRRKLQKTRKAKRKQSKKKTRRS